MTRVGGRNLTRERIAHLAARLMAQDGIDDYAIAKRKAARQVGVAQTRELPSNDEIDAALRTYQELYQSEYPAQLQELRHLALEIMDEFARFTPYLTGAALNGHAGASTGIHLHLYTEDAKAVTHELLNRGIDFRTRETRLYACTVPLVAPTLSYLHAGVEVCLTVLSRRELRLQLTASVDGKPIERAKREAVAALFAEE